MSAPAQLVGVEIGTEGHSVGCINRFILYNPGNAMKARNMYTGR